MRGLPALHHRVEDGVHTYALSVRDLDMPEPRWAGLYTSWPDDPGRQPYQRFAINNNDGEALAVWRALAWTLTAHTERWAIPSYYRDQAAEALGIAREQVELVPWEYEVDIESPGHEDADTGFVRGRSVVPIRPAPDDFTLRHRAEAGLFPLRRFEELTALALAVGGDASSEITIFGLQDGGRYDGLLGALRSEVRPEVRSVVRPGDVFVDLSVSHDLVGATSHLTVKSVTDVGDRIGRAVEACRGRWRVYCTRVDAIAPNDFDGFAATVTELLGDPDRIA